MLPECQLLGPQHAGVNPGCLSSQQNTLLWGYHFGESHCFQVPLTFHHLSRCSADRAVSISQTISRLCHLTQPLTPPPSCLTSSLATRGALPPPDFLVPLAHSRSSVLGHFISPSQPVLSHLLVHCIRVPLNKSPALAAGAPCVRSLALLARWTLPLPYSPPPTQTAHHPPRFQGLSCFDSLLQHSKKKNKKKNHQPVLPDL